MSGGGMQYGIHHDKSVYANPEVLDLFHHLTTREAREEPGLDRQHIVRLYSLRPQQPALAPTLTLVVAYIQGKPTFIFTVAPGGCVST